GGCTYSRSTRSHAVGKSEGRPGNAVRVSGVRGGRCRLPGGVGSGDGEGQGQAADGSGGAASGERTAAAQPRGGPGEGAGPGGRAAGLARGEEPGQVDPRWARA